MPEIAPFAGIRYRLPDAELTRVLAPPYDVIPPSYQDELYARDPRNIVRVVLNREPGDEAYRAAGDTWRALQADGVVAADDAPSLYVLEQTFSAEGATLTRLGLLARFRATDPGAGQVLPHEHTRAAAKEDRYKLLKATRANFSPIFLMSEDPGGRFAGALLSATAASPVATYTDDAGVAHRMWRVTDPRQVAAFQQALGKPKAYIADGHHRYATALRYRDEVARDGEWTFGYFTPLDSPGMLVLPYHRLLAEGPSLDEARQRLAGAFLRQRLRERGLRRARGGAVDHAVRVRPGRAGRSRPGGGGAPGGRGPAARRTRTRACARSTPSSSTSVVLPRLGLDDGAVRYVHSLAEAELSLAHARCRLALLLRATPVRQIVDVAEAKESMPAKSTFFHPKLPSALVVHPLLA